MMILVAKTPAKEGVAKIAAHFARHFYPSTPLFLKSWIHPCSLSFLSSLSPLQSPFLCLSLLLSLLSYTCSSYIHAEWATFDKLLRGDKRFDGKVKRYKQKQAQLGIFANVSLYSTCTCTCTLYMTFNLNVCIDEHNVLYVVCTCTCSYIYIYMYMYMYVYFY